MRSASLMLISALLLLSACSERKGLETGKKLFKHYCLDCHAVQYKGAFLNNIKLSSLTRRSSFTVSNTILNDRKHGAKPVKKLNELSGKESEKLVKYLYQLKVEYETRGELVHDEMLSQWKAK